MQTQFTLCPLKSDNLTKVQAALIWKKYKLSSQIQILPPTGCVPLVFILLVCIISV